MPRRKSAAQSKAEFRRAQSKQKQAVRKAKQEISRYNRKVKAHNAQVERDVNNYNKEVRAYNARRQRALENYNRAARQQQAQLRTPARTTHIRSVSSLQESFTRLERSEGNHAYSDLLDLSEREATNSAEAINSLLDDNEPGPATDDEIKSLQATAITTELKELSTDLDERWRGALFSLHPDNPDVSRHFCTSAREAVASLLEVVAPDEAVKEANPDYLKTPQGDISRRARIHYCLAPHGHPSEELVDFVEDDIDNVIDLFDDFNSGTHGKAGRFPLLQLNALKTRVEDAIKFIYQLARQ